MNRVLYGVLVVWPTCLTGLFVNAIGVFTLGYYVPSWDVRLAYALGLRYARYYAKYRRLRMDKYY